jgi:hypothetical protein
MGARQPQVALGSTAHERALTQDLDTLTDAGSRENLNE